MLSHHPENIEFNDINKARIKKTQEKFRKIQKNKK
jgi:hypothetical protein